MLLFLQAVNNHCFPALLTIPQPQFKLVLDSIIWAFKHTMRNVANTGKIIEYLEKLNLVEPKCSFVIIKKVNDDLVKGPSFKFNFSTNDRNIKYICCL